MWGSHRVDGVPALVAAAAPLVGVVGWGGVSFHLIPHLINASPVVGWWCGVWLGGTLLLPVTEVRTVPVRAPGAVMVCGVVGGGCAGLLVHAVGS